MGSNTLKGILLLSEISKVLSNTRSSEIKVDNSNLIPVNRDRLRVGLL
jgi:hypothetical protein